MKTKTGAKVLTGFLLIVLLIMSCKKDKIEQASTGQNINDVINSNASYSIFAYAIKKTGMEIFTEGSGPFTFFIPSNDAFAKAGITKTEDIDKISPLFLTVLMGYHFQGVKRTFYEIPEGPNATMASQTNVTQYGSRYLATDKAYINGVQLLDKGTVTPNGIYYNIGELIQPPYFTNAIVMMQNVGNYSLMLQAIDRTKVSTTFTTTPSTVFTVPNSVMLANGYDSVRIANVTPADSATLANILKYHVVAQRIFKSDFRTGTLQTRFTGNVVTIGGTQGNFTIKGRGNAAEQAVGNGIATGAGVFYQLTELLKP